MSRPGNPRIAASRAREAAPAPVASSDGQRLDSLASRLNLCSFSNADPERFHVERNAIVVEMRRMAAKLDGRAAGRPDYTWRAPPRA